jgi:hypothetical protein
MARKRLTDELLTCRELRERDRIEINMLRKLVRTLIENDPNDDAADSVTVLEVWRQEARQVLSSLAIFAPERRAP